MKRQEIQFRRPVKIFQVFTNINVYGKDAKSFDDRKEKLTWKALQSKSGFVENGELFLPAAVAKNPDLPACDLITMEDDNIPRPMSPLFIHEPGGIARWTDRTQGRTFNHCIDFTKLAEFEIFRFRKREEVELHLHYDYFKVGIPQRKNFKLCELRKGEPVEIRINGKLDASGSAGAERTYKEQAYVFVYVGDFEKCAILNEPYDPVIKHVPADRKVVDLLKELW